MNPAASNPSSRDAYRTLMKFVRTVRPHQCTFVPDTEGQFTLDHGWKFPQDLDRLRPLVAQARAWGVRVSLFHAAAEAAHGLGLEVEFGLAETVRAYRRCIASAFPPAGL